MKILGFEIRLAKPPAKQVKAEAKKRAVSKQLRRRQKREVSYEIADITQAITIAANIDNPDRGRLHEIYDYIERDGEVVSQLRTAYFNVESEPWLLYRDGNPDMPTSELYNATWFNTLIRYALMAEFRAYAVVELEDINPQEAAVGQVILIPHNHVCIEKQWILIEGTINGEYLPYGEHMQELNLLQFGSENGHGIYLPCAYNVIWKYYSRFDWSRASEKAGMPIVAIKADTNDDIELDEMEQRASQLTADGYIVVQATDDVSFLERKNENGHVIYKDNMAYCDEQIDKIINGNTAVSNTKSFTGSAEVQERNMNDFTMSRLQSIANEINDRVLPFLVAKGFGLEGLRFDYPELRRRREAKINGPQMPTPTEAPKPPENKEEPEDV